MTRFQNLLLATILMTSTSAFAADTPDPKAKGEAALPSGSNETPPSTPPAGTATGSNAGEQSPATSPGEENKGKPKTPDQ
jgi:hypothetical protein